MAPKRAPAPSSIPPSTASPSHGQTTASSAPTKPTTSTPSRAPSTPAKGPKPTSSSSTANLRSANDAQSILTGIYERYVEKTPQRTKLIDTFMGFLIVVGGLQFLYCVIAGNYPFNAFLSGFAATVGQFVLAVSLRMQTTEGNEEGFGGRSHERAFADFVLGSVILHFFCVNFIN